MYPRPPSSVALLLAMGIVAELFTSCSHSSDSVPSPSLGRSLLSSAPSYVRETPGRIRPDTSPGWGAHKGPGWAPKLRTVGSVKVAESIDASAEILVDSAGFVGSTIELDLASLVSVEPIKVLLNEQLIGEAVPTRALTTFHFEAPDATWRLGQNRIQLVGSPGGKVLFGELRLDPAAVFDRQHSSIDSGVTVEWDVIAGLHAFIDVEASADSIGHFELNVFGSVPGEVERSLLETAAQDVEAGEVVRLRLGLGANEALLKHVRLAWRGEPGSRLSLTRLNLVEGARSPMPSILFISIDTLSAQNMSIYGYNRQTTPHLADFVADSVLFEQARSNAPWTVPSYISQLSGLYASANRMIPDEDGNQGRNDYVMPAERFTIAEMLRATGYRTAAFVNNPWLNGIPGFSQGFDVYDTKAAEATIGDPSMGMRYVLPAALEFLRSSTEKPAFAFAQILDVHGPYHPNPPFEGQFSEGLDASVPDWLPIANTDKAIFGTVPAYIASLRKADAQATQIRGSFLRADYDEKVLELDAYLGEFFEALKAEGVYDDLLIIFSADHGESMEDHDFYFRHGLVYDSAIHVPLVVKLPKQEAAGRRVHEPVQLVDLYPTFAEWIGQGALTSGHGRSLVPALNGAELNPVASMSQANLLNQTSLVRGDWKLVVSWPLEASAEAYLTYPPFQQHLFRDMPDEFVSILGQTPPVAPRQIVGALESLLKDEPNLYWKIVKHIRGYDPVMELYNLKQDPNELADVSHENAERTQALYQELTRELERAESLRDFTIDDQSSMSEEQDGALRALGYVGD